MSAICGTFSGCTNDPTCTMSRPLPISRVSQWSLVAVGTTWPIDEKRLKEDFSDDGEGGMEIGTLKATGKLEKIEEHKGVRCAVLLIDITGDGSLMGQKDLVIKLKLKAWIWLALDSGRPLTMKGDGTGDLAGELEQDGNKIKMDGKFTFKAEGEMKYE